jgi:predicted HTH domain antitoxin
MYHKLRYNVDQEGKMSSTICMEIPREVLHSTRMTVDDLRRELALHLFEQGKLSFGKAREMAGMSVWAFQQLLGSRGITVHYDLAEYEEDLATLEDLQRL